MCVCAVLCMCAHVACVRACGMCARVRVRVRRGERRGEVCEEVRGERCVGEKVTGRISRILRVFRMYSDVFRECARIQCIANVFRLYSDVFRLYFVTANDEE